VPVLCNSSELMLLVFSTAGARLRKEHRLAAKGLTVPGNVKQKSEHKQWNQCQSAIPQYRPDPRRATVLPIPHFRPVRDSDLILMLKTKTLKKS